MDEKFYLPSKLNSCLRRLDLEYERTNTSQLKAILKGSRIAVLEGATYDNWNGGTYTHDLIFFLPSDLMSKIALDAEPAICARLVRDLNACAGGAFNESFGTASLKLFDESDPLFQGTVSLSNQPYTNPDTVSFWTPGFLRVFISHRDTKKSEAHELADNLKTYGVTAFVAHDTIEPTTSWQTEIEKALHTMEIMVAFITDDFHESVWTNQEIGFALGKGTPIVAVKLEKEDPRGFIGAKQALKGNLQNASSLAADLYKLLAETLGQRSRLQQTIIAAFVAASDFDQARDRFDRMDSTIDVLSESEFDVIRRGFSANGQLHNSIYLNNNRDRLKKFLERSTGKRIAVGKTSITEIKSSVSRDMDDDIPF